MNSEQFCYWLQGWFELNKTIDHREGATKETLDVIEAHLQLVFTKVTPPVKFPDYAPNQSPATPGIVIPSILSPGLGAPKPEIIC